MERAPETCSRGLFLSIFLVVIVPSPPFDRYMSNIADGARKKDAKRGEPQLHTERNQLKKALCVFCYFWSKSPENLEHMRTRAKTALAGVRATVK